MYYYTNTVLYHHGILGMHWGIRRYQNRDGSLTAEGIKRYRTDLKFKTKYDKYAAKQDAKNQEKAAKREAERINKIKTKSVKDLTDDELRERIQRLELEKKVIDLERAVNGGGQNNNQNNSQNKAVQETMSFGKKFAKGVIDGTTKMATAYVSKKIFNALVDKIGDASGDSKKEVAKAVKDVVQDAVDSAKNSDSKKNGKNKKDNKPKNNVDRDDTRDAERSSRIMSYDDFVDQWDSENSRIKSPSIKTNFLDAGRTPFSSKYDFLVDVGSKNGVSDPSTGMLRSRGEDYMNEFFSGAGKRSVTALDFDMYDTLKDYNNKR